MAKAVKKAAEITGGIVVRDASETEKELKVLHTFVLLFGLTGLRPDRIRFSRWADRFSEPAGLAYLERGQTDREGLNFDFDFNNIHTKNKRPPEGH